ncbi:hypothetical protein ROSMUCSMR3_03541 [Roseovarius mucosus]|uniref:Uncharacterized protein n=1 Tax=Roseovarius mucosus TaxID=215743 RepID=A0A1V0RTL9_9RHOB|nr:hypothetical protein [Roseovarius mucosus]ARE84995.1 hypothetical protein ROSMUCSMR3_03541 [Roseovarius mucosus]
MTRILSRSDVSKARELNVCKAKAKDAVNKRMDQIRSRFITSIAGQSMIYMAKEAEALAYVAATPEPNTVAGWEQDYPFIAGEVGSTGSSAYEVAQVFLNLAAQWRDIGAQLEKARIETIQAISLSQSVTDTDDALGQFEAEIAEFDS